MFYLENFVIFPNSLTFLQQVYENKSSPIKTVYYLKFHNYIRFVLKISRNNFINLKIANQHYCFRILFSLKQIISV